MAQSTTKQTQKKGQASISQFFSIREHRKCGPSALSDDDASRQPQSNVSESEVIVIDSDDDDNTAFPSSSHRPTEIDKTCCNAEEDESKKLTGEHDTRKASVADVGTKEKKQSGSISKAPINLASLEKSVGEDTQDTQPESASERGSCKRTSSGAIKSTKSNPFARFAATKSPSSSSPIKQSSLTQWMGTNATTQKQPSKAQTFRSTDGTEFVKMQDLSAHEQHRIVIKWHSLVRCPPLLAQHQVSLEDRRWHLFVAARLHARCQETTVRKAIKSLMQHFYSPNKAEGGLTVLNLSQSDPEDWMDCLSGLQYYRTKAKQLHAAANEICTRHRGIVPESEHELKKLTGIGPVFSDLLAFVNARAKHEDFLQQMSSA